MKPRIPIADNRNKEARYYSDGLKQMKITGVISL